MGPFCPVCFQAFMTKSAANRHIKYKNHGEPIYKRKGKDEERAKLNSRKVCSLFPIVYKIFNTDFVFLCSPLQRISSVTGSKSTLKDVPDTKKK